MRKYFFVFFVFLSIPLFAAQSIVVLPFNNESKTPQAYWLGEGFAESLTEDLLLKDAYVIQRPDRKAAYDTLRLPYVGHVSRATMLKLGKQMGADYIVFGTYTIAEKNLKVEAQVIQTSSSRLSPPISAAGQLEHLYTVQGQLTRALKNFFFTQKLTAVENKAETALIPLHAYELYIKGLLETSDQAKVDFFQRAVAAHADYPQARYRLALAQYRLGRYRESNESLSRISGDGILRARVEFLTALNLYLLRDINGSAQKWYKLSQSYPAPEIYNNIGIALLGRNEVDNAIAYLSKAVELDPEHPDLRFNLGVALTQKGTIEDAIDIFRQAVELNPNDYNALYWLARDLERAGKPQAKRVMEIFQERVPRDQKGKFPKQDAEITQSLKLSSGYLSNEERRYVDVTRAKIARQRVDYLKTYQGSARKYLNEREPDRAILEIQKGMTFAPFDWYLHHLWGQALIAKGNRGGAVPHLQFSLWCMENIDSHILLAEMYRDSQQYAASKKHIQQILALDPKHKKAIEIWSKIHNKN